ncbi:MAG: tetratricopeptide repeat protein [Planctomycetaceae bacterium]|nr:tetratricopeptide repeat protein [Planctomycetaceae bacterium]
MSDLNVPDHFDFLKSSPCLKGERVAFTGTLASMTHRQARELVEEYGGQATHSISHQTTMLVIGEEGWLLDDDGKVPQKLKQAEELQAAGHLRILHESNWLYLMGIQYNRDEIRQLYTPAMLQQLLDIPAHTIRAWERAGLIRPVRKIYRLPYFDFEEVTTARRLTEMLKAGVSRQEIEKSLQSLSKHLDGIDRPLQQLDILERDSHLFYRDHVGLLEPRTGQRVFDFETQEAEESADHSQENQDEDHDILAFEMPEHLPERLWSPEDWFDEGCQQMDEGDLAAAVEAFRMSLIEDYDSPVTHFHLAEALYRQDKVDAALERYHMVVELDHNYIEAWTQIGCLHAEMHEYEEALDAFDLVIRIHPDCPEALWFRGDTLRELGQIEEAIESWRSYLKFDQRGPWAEMARQYLEQYAGESSAQQTYSSNADSSDDNGDTSA